MHFNVDMRASFDPIADEVIENPRLSLSRLGLENADLNEVHFTGNYVTLVEYDMS